MMLKRASLMVGVVALAAAVGCAGRSTRPNSPSYYGGYGGQGQPSDATASAPAPRSESYGDAEESADEAPSECCGGATQSARAPEPMRRERPGLGTVFGEARRSEVKTVSFVRASASPFALLDARYNDAEGTRAMIDRLMGRGATPGYAPTRIAEGVDVSIVNEYGTPLTAYVVGGKMQVVGEAGQRYALRISNRSRQRFEVVASVDGLDVLDGKRAELSKRGYVVEAWGTLTIEGFRTSFSEVAAFRFGSVGESYAERTGEGRNVGVIAVAIFGEYGAQGYDDDELDRRENAEPFAKPPPGWVAQ